MYVPPVESVIEEDYDFLVEFSGNFKAIFAEDAAQIFFDHLDMR